jgi:hypothetical protein
MAKNPYYDPNPANWWHGDEMYQGKEASVDDAWATWETGQSDCDGWGRQEWIDDMRRSDFLNDMSNEVLSQLMQLIATNRRDKNFSALAKYTASHIECVLEE